MCGRYTLMKLADLLKLIPWLQVPAEVLERQSRFNVAPSQVLPIVVESHGQTVLRDAKWGFVASWTKEKPRTQPINARSETVGQSGLFRRAFAERRCLVPADGFYEWKGAKPPKQPYLIRLRDHGLFAFAGLWERWYPPAGEPTDTFTILTTAPNELMKGIHDRMPVIVPPDGYRRWLTGEPPQDLLKPYPAELMEAVPVSPRVSSPKFDDPGCIEPISAP
ncbi:MAG TPA: SOS response-associated peptidase [Tepidisphaeraceae bacterium]|nr:SOS response-associated peptidase [Tepidisphaeraceae bacterium]